MYSRFLISFKVCHACHFTSTYHAVWREKTLQLMVVIPIVLSPCSGLVQPVIFFYMVTCVGAQPSLGQQITGSDRQDLSHHKLLLPPQKVVEIYEPTKC